MGNDPATVTKHVKAFFITSGYACPRAALGIPESQLEKFMNHAKGQDSSNVTIFIPQDRKEEIGIGQVLTLAKEYRNLEWQTQNLIETVANRKGEDTLPRLENTILNALSMLGVSPSAMKVIQTANALKLKSSDIPGILNEASMGDLSASPL